MITLRYREIMNTQLMRVVVLFNFLAAESESDNRFSPTRLNFAAHKVTIFRKNRKSKNYFLKTMVNCHTLEYF